MNITRLIGTGLITAALTAVVIAQAPALNVRMGLWEVTTTAKVGGQMPMDTSKMTPAQKAQMEAAMQSAMQAMTQPHVTKSCIKKEDFDLAKMMGDKDETCKQTLKTNTATLLDGSVTCTGDNPSTQEMRIQATSPTTITGSIKGTSTGGGHTMTMDMALSGKWLSASCGNVE